MEEKFRRFFSGKAHEERRGDVTTVLPDGFIAN